MFGFLNVYKPKGKTSHDIVAILRKLTKIKQIGHTGTLDPFAEGVLPICIGKATRLIEYLDDEKAYIGTIQLGSSTSTYDIEGEVVKKSDKKVDLLSIEKELSKFMGDILQVPPIYSAIKVDGKKLYEYARRGEVVNIQPRSIKITKLEIIDFDEDNQVLQLYIECSKGTYIRSIANDLGEALGCFGYLTKLVRTKAGSFELKASVKLDSLNNYDDVFNSLINPINYLNYPSYELVSSEKVKVMNGMQIQVEQKDGKIIFTYQNKIVAIAEVLNKKAKILKVFI